MDADNSTLKAQRDALRSFLAVQERAKQLEVPLAPERKKTEETLRQQADASRRKVANDQLGLDQLRAESAETANGMMQSVNQSRNEVTSALRAASLNGLISDPPSFRASSDGLGDPAQALRRCQATAKEAQEAVQQALIELQEQKERRLTIILVVATAVLFLVVAVAVKFA
jgi:hypothetical protein